MPRNLELKVPFAVTADRRATLARLGAAPRGVIEQTDTYFHTRQGRLKVREVTGGGAELIAYARPDDADVRASDYVVVPLADGAATVAALATALGRKVVVRKRREVLRWHNVRIHLDAVDGLGDFLEFEAEVGEGTGEGGASEAVSAERLATLTRELGIDPAGAIAGSYSDMLLARTGG
jgi:adenylate cyclase class 2